MGSIFRKGSEQSGQSQGISMDMANRVAQKQIDLGERQAAIAEPLQRGVAGVFNEFLSNRATPDFLDLPATVSPLANLSLPNLGAEQGRLRNELMSQGSRGGLLQQQLGQLSLQGSLNRVGLQQQDLLRQEARDVQRAGLRQSLFGGAGELGTGSQSLAFQGLAQGAQTQGAAASNLNSLGLQRIQQNMAAQQGIGQALGAGLGMLGKGCWIAMRLYGPDAPATHLLRFWLGAYRPTWWFTRFYQRYGRWLSQRCWVGLWRPWFDYLTRCARRDLYGDAR